MNNLQESVAASQAAPLIIALETSGRMGSVALASGPHLLAEQPFSAAMRHSAELFSAISLLLKGVDKSPSDIDDVYISAGPGSFTGLRIAASFAKALDLARNARLIAVPTLDVLAANVADFEIDSSSTVPRIGVVLDAKRGQFFVAAFKNSQEIPAKDRPAKFLHDAAMTAEQFLDNVRPDKEPVWLLGEGLVYYRHKFAAEGVEFLPQEYWNPRASKVHLLGWRKASRGEYADPPAFAPAYLGRPDVTAKTR